MNKNTTAVRAALDGRVFWSSVCVILAVIIPLTLFPESGAAAVKQVFNFATGQFGWLYLLAGVSILGFMLWLALGRYGHVRLGRAEDLPEFPYFSWVAMMFCAGIGTSVCIWAWVEPIYYFDGPPLGISSKSTEAAEWALAYGQFHWGIVPWAIYGLLAIPIAYSMYVRREPGVRLSVIARSLLGDKADKWPGVTLDVIVVFGIVGGVGTSLGLAVPLISTLVSDLFGLTPSFGLDMLILAIWTALFSWSVWNGLNGGIKILSNINVYMALFLLAFIFAIGPTLFIIKSWVNSQGLMLNNLLHMALWTDPVAGGSFTQDWTVFYWAWWIAYAPMMGLFTARISRGRTIRELVFVQLVWGSLGCWVFFAVWGGYALDLQLTGKLDVLASLANGIPETILAILKTTPMSSFVIGAFILLCFVFLATTLDSAAYVLASVSSKKLSGYEEPQRWIRLTWALLMAFVGVGLIKAGSLKAVQTSTIVVALPLIPVLGVLSLATLRMLKQDFAARLNPPQVIIDSKPLETQPVSTIDKASQASLKSVLEEIPA